jgi:two-component system, NarL family, response regulator LiaR
MASAHRPAESAGVEAGLLVVDDNESFRRTAVTLLTVRGFTVIAAVAGRDEAVALVARTCPDGVLMDINLVGSSGYEASTAVRQACPGSRVVLTSASVEDVPRDLLDACGAVTFVPKIALASIDLHELFLDGERPLSPDHADT